MASPPGPAVPAPPAADALKVALSNAVRPARACGLGYEQVREVVASVYDIQCEEGGGGSDGTGDWTEDGTGSATAEERAAATREDPADRGESAVNADPADGGESAVNTDPADGGESASNVASGNELADELGLRPLAFESEVVAAGARANPAEQHFSPAPAEAPADSTPGADPPATLATMNLSSVLRGDGTVMIEVEVQQNLPLDAITHAMRSLLKSGELAAVDLSGENGDLLEGVTINLTTTNNITVNNCYGSTTVITRQASQGRVNFEEGALLLQGHFA